MQQLEIQYFFPLTEQIPLDLDYRPSYAYEAKKRADKIAGSVLYSIGGNTPPTLNLMADTIVFKAHQDAVGYWQINKELQVWNKKKPNWVHRKITKLMLGWEWKDR